jgi:ribose transport system substrate-binding protein
MSTGSLARTRRVTHTVATTGFIAALAAASLAACGGSSGGSGSAAGTSSSSKLASEVAALTKPLNAYPVPKTPIKNAKSLAGKTIYYVPISQQAPQFGITATALKTAAKTVGMTVQVCDGKGQPSSIAACIGQGTQARAAAIIADAIPFGLAANSFKAAEAAKIPVIIGNNLPTADAPPSASLAYIGGEAGSRMEEALAKWTTLDSKGKANLLINMNTDGPSPVEFAAAGKKTLAAECPDCKVTTNKVSSSNFSLVASSTSAALLKDPNINYVQSQYEQFLQVTQAGVQQTSRSVKLTAGAAQLDSVKAVAKGGLAAAAGQATAYEGWVYLDAALRMRLAEKLPSYTIPVRLFTKDTVSASDETTKAQTSGTWFGPANFADKFKKIWGVA